MFSPDVKPSPPPIRESNPAGAQLLLIHVISQAVEDHGMGAWRHEVDAFFLGPAFARYCVLLGWNEDWARRRIQSFVAQRRPVGRAVDMRRRNTKFD
jgi:hypothetical protein